MDEIEIREVIDELQTMKQQVIILIALITSYRSSRLISESEEDLKGLEVTGEMFYELNEFLKYISNTRNSYIQELSKITQKLYSEKVKQDYVCNS